ncbi:MAG: hypothetical protein ACYC6L_15150, partial [Anaerolineae bacterium]
MPVYRDAAYGGETVVLENSHIRLEVHKRITGWGWGELYLPGPSGKPDLLYGVIEHLAEAWIEGQPYPMRLEAQEYTQAESAGGSQLSFNVKMQQVEPPDSTYNEVSPLLGTVTLSLAPDDALVRYKMSLEPQFQIRLRRIRGLWLRVGANSFGAAKQDAIFPGIEWLVGKEWSSGTEWFEHPNALRLTPHPHKVAFPLMAISYGGYGLGLAWSNSSQAMSDAVRLRCPQPVFAAPNFVDRRDHSLMGIMWPSARWGMPENALAAENAIKVRKGLKLELEAEITAVKGASLEVVCDWINRHGMPEPGKPRYEWHDLLDRIASAYNSNLWIEGQGWGFRGRGSTAVPGAVSWYVAHGRDAAIAAGLKAKIAWAKQQQVTVQPSRDPLSQPHSIVLGHTEKA